LLKKSVGIIMGSDSDLPVVKEAAKVLESLGIGYDMVIASAHRTPELTKSFVKNCEDNGFSCIIAAAGGAAHLPGVVAAYTTLPVIGIPIESKALSGVDSLYSIVQMPSGIPVATMAIGGAKNAGLFAAQIVSLSDETVRENFKAYRLKMKSEVEGKNEKLQRLGWEAYLEQK